MKEERKEKVMKEERLTNQQREEERNNQTMKQLFTIESYTVFCKIRQVKGNNSKDLREFKEMIKTISKEFEEEQTNNNN